LVDRFFAAKSRERDKPGTPYLLRSLWQKLRLVFGVFATFSAHSQIQQAWVARYNNGITNGTNQAAKMTLDTSGNIYVTGFSQNANSQLGYVTIKYASNGNQLWATRYDSTNYTSATPSALALDSNNDVFITGSALTIKYDPNGNQLWAQPYAGTALAVDPSGDVYITGFGTNFNTIKLSPTGSNLWLTTYQDVGPSVGQGIVVDSNGNAYVSGSDTFRYYVTGPFTNAEAQLLTIKYTPNGSQAWPPTYLGYPPNTPTGVQVRSIAVDSAGSLYVTIDWSPNTLGGYVTCKYSNSGSLVWTAFPEPGNGNNMPNSLLVNTSSNVLLVGQIFHMGHSGFSTIELDTNGATVWTNLYPASYSGTGCGMGMAIDSANNVYVTGYSPGSNSLNDIVTIKYGPNGNHIWLQRYNGPGDGNDAGNAIAVDNNGNVYVTGYDTTAAGGTEIVTIKYSPITLKKQANGTILLQAQGYAGENFDIQASADLLNWLDLGIVTADTNGLMQFDDTNAPNYPARFYFTNPQ